MVKTVFFMLGRKRNWLRDHVVPEHARRLWTVRGYIAKMPQWTKQRATIPWPIRITIAYAIFWYLCWNLLDPDFGWHIMAGNYIRDHGVPLRDVFTYTASSSPWINHEWASDYIVSVTHQLGGYSALCTLYAALWTFGFAIQRVRIHLFTWCIVILSASQYIGIRGIAWTVFFLGLSLRILSTNPVTKNSLARYRYWSFVPLICIWANLHGGFMLGLGLLGFYGLRYRRYGLIVILLCSSLATIINPYGIHLYTEIARTLLDPSLHKSVDEWRPFYLSFQAYVFAGIWAVGFVVFEWLQHKVSPVRPSSSVPQKNRSLIRRSYPLVTLQPLLFAASLSASRNFPLFLVSAAPRTDVYITDLLQIFARGRLQIIKGATLILGIIFVAASSAHLLDGLQAREANYPVGAVAYLQQHPCAGNLFNSYDFGGYLIWKLPNKKVYIDGRMPSWKDESGIKYMSRYFGVLRDPMTRDQEFSRYDIRCVLIGTSGSARFIDELKKAGWTTQTTDRTATLMTKP